MKHLRKFNEDKIEKFVEDLESQYLAYLVDAGFTFGFHEMDEYYPDVNTIDIYKIKTEDGFFWEDIKYDFFPFVEKLMKHFNVKYIKFYIPNKNDRTQHIFVYSSDKKTKLNFNSIDDFFEEKGIPDSKLLAIDITFVLKNEKP